MLNQMVLIRIHDGKLRLRWEPVHWKTAAELEIYPVITEPFGGQKRNVLTHFEVHPDAYADEAK